MRHPVRLAAGAAACFVAFSHAGLAATRIGDATQVVRQVSGSVGGRTRTIAPNDEVFQAETIRTGSESSAHLRFLDRTDLSIGGSATLPRLHRRECRQGVPSHATRFRPRP